MSQRPEFHELLNEHLRHADRSARWVARRLNVHPSTVSRWTNGETKPQDSETVARLADVLNVYDPEERRKLFAASDFAFQNDVTPPSKADTFSAAGGLIQTVGNALIEWRNDVLSWNEAPASARASWAGMTLYVLSALTDRVTPRYVMAVIVTMLLWGITAALVAPGLEWPIEEIAVRRTVLVRFGLATLLVPLCIAGVTRADGHERFGVETIRQRLTLLTLKFTGALVGFYTFVMIVLGITLGWYYLTGGTVGNLFRRLLTGVPLFFGYIVARQVPLWRWETFNECLRLHRVDRWFLGAYLVVAPLTAVFLYVAYPILAHRIQGGLLLLIVLVIATLLEQQRDRQETEQRDGK